MKDKVLIDSNIFILLIVGIIDKNRINQYKRTSIYDKNDFEYLNQFISFSFNNLITTPNIWTEVDNLLNRLDRDNYKYIQVIDEILKQSLEIFEETKKSIKDYFDFPKLGITDLILLKIAKNCKIFISDDSELCDVARAKGIKIFDFKEWKNKKILNPNFY